VITGGPYGSATIAMGSIERPSHAFKFLAKGTLCILIKHVKCERDWLVLSDGAVGYIYQDVLKVLNGKTKK